MCTVNHFKFYRLTPSILNLTAKNAAGNFVYCNTEYTFSNLIPEDHLVNKNLWINVYKKCAQVNFFSGNCNRSHQPDNEARWNVTDKDISFQQYPVAWDKLFKTVMRPHTKAKVSNHYQTISLPYQSNAQSAEPCQPAHCCSFVLWGMCWQGMYQIDLTLAELYLVLL